MGEKAEIQIRLEDTDGNVSFLEGSEEPIIVTEEPTEVNMTTGDLMILDDLHSMHIETEHEDFAFCLACLLPMDMTQNIFTLENGGKEVDPSEELIDMMSQLHSQISVQTVPTYNNE